MADNMNNNIAILSLMAKLEDNSKEISAQAKKMIGKVEKNAGTVEFTGNTKEIKNAINEINKLMESKLKGIDLTKQFIPILKVFSDAENSAEDYLDVLKNVKEELDIISNFSSKTRDLMQNLSPKDSQKVLDEYKKLTKQQDNFAKKQEQAKKKLDKIEGASVISLMRQYKGTDEYENASSEKQIESLRKQLGFKEDITKATKNEIKQYSQLLSIFNSLQNEKKELAGIDTAEAAYKEVQINKNLLNIVNEIIKKENRLSSSFGAKNLESSNIEGFSIGEVERNTRSSIGKYVDLATKDFKITTKEINAQIEKTASDLVKASANKMINQAEKVSSEAQAKLEKYNSKKSSSTRKTDVEGDLNQVGTNAQNVTDDVQKLDTALDDLGDNSGLDLWVESAKNLKEEFSDVVKYAVDAETALEKIISLNKALNNRALSEDEEKDLVGFSQRYLALGKDLSEDQEDTFYDYADDYKNMIVQIQSMTEKQLSEIEKLKVAQKEVVEQPASESSATSSMEKQIGETTEAVEKLAQAEKEVIEHTKKLEQELPDGNFTDKEEIEKLTSTLKELQDVSKVKVDVDITEAITNTEAIHEKIDKLPEVKDIKIRVSNDDYSNTSLLSDEEGKTITAFRGVKNAWSGVVNDKEIAFFTDQLELAADYADSLAESGKIYAANLSFKNPLEIDGNGAIWNEIEFDGIKRTTDEIVEIAKQLGHDGVIFRNIRDGFGEANGELSNVMVTLNRAQIKNEEVIASVKAGSGEMTKILNSEIEPNANIESQQKLQAELQETEQQAKETATALSDVDQSSVLSVNQTEVLSNQTPLSSDSKMDEIAKETAIDVEQANEKIIASNKEVVASEEAKEKAINSDKTQTSALQTEKQVVDSVVDSEKVKLKELENAVSLVIEEIDRKTQAFHNEKAAVDMIIPAEIATLEALEGELITIRELIEQISKVPIDLSFDTTNLDENTQKVLKEITESLNNIDTSSLGNIGNILEGFKISKSNVENLQKLANAILTLKSNLNNVGSQGQQFLSDIKELIAQADGLKDLATVLKATKSQIANAKQGTETPTDEEATKAKELAKDYDRLIVKLEKFNTTLNNVETKPKKTSAYIDEINDIRSAIDSINKLDTSVDIIDENEIKNLELSISNIEKRIKSLDDEKFSLVSDDEINNLLKQASKIYNKNTAAPKELRDGIKGVITDLERMKNGLEEADRITFNKVKSSLKEFETQIEKTGKTGASMGDKIKKKFGDVFAYFATYVSIQDFIQMFRQGFETIKEYDNALTEMNKVSEESIHTLKEFQNESFDLADSIGATASQIQNSTADWMRLGESLEEAKQSAQDANILFNVSEFETIDEATDSLVSMSQAFKDLEKGDIIDVVNNLGNNFAISTDGLATALKDSASSLQTAQNDFYESAALVTAANTVVQDPAKVGAGLRTIALRLTGTEAAREELSALGEDVDDFVVTTTSKMDQQIKDLTKTQGNFGVSLLDMNGNYRSTYEVLLDIAKVWDKIAEEDLATGENRQNALLEMMAGKNRSNILASVLQSPEILEEAYAYALDSEGSAMRENEAYLESIEAHLAQLKNAWDALWVNENNREVITFFLDLAKGILEVVDDIGVLNTALLTIGAGFGIKKSLDGGGRAKCCPSSEYATGEFSSDVYELCIA